MRQFFDLPHFEQALLLVKVVQLIADGDTYKRIEDVAAGRDTSSQGLWLQLCADEGFDQCEPWPGFPDLPKNFPIHRIGTDEHPLVAKSRAKLTAASCA